MSQESSVFWWHLPLSAWSGGCGSTDGALGHILHVRKISFSFLPWAKGIPLATAQS